METFFSRVGFFSSLFAAVFIYIAFWGWYIPNLTTGIFGFWEGVGMGFGSMLYIGVQYFWAVTRSPSREWTNLLDVGVSFVPLIVLFIGIYKVFGSTTTYQSGVIILMGSAALIDALAGAYAAYRIARLSDDVHIERPPR